MVYSVSSVCDTIGKGDYLTMKKCWECNQVPLRDATPLKNGSRCQTAAYCSKECQIAAWKSGHKHKCSSLEVKMRQFEQLVQEVDDTHERCDFHGLRLAYNLDYDTAALVDSSVFLDDVDGPSMKIYYRNLERIVKGEWWLFGNPTRYEPNRNRHINQRADIHDRQFGFISLLLMYDVVPFTEANESDSNNTGTLNSNIQHHPSLTEDWRKAFRFLFENPVTASQYLAAYEIWTEPKCSPASAATRKIALAEATGKVRDLHHK